MIMRSRLLVLSLCGAILVVARAAEPQAQAPPHPGAELTVTRSVEVAASPTELWDFAGQFEHVDNLLPIIEDLSVDGEGIGSTRSFTADGARVIERLDSLEEGKSYGYSFVQAPIPVEDYHATITVSPVDAGHSIFTWQGRFRAKGVSDEQARSILEGIYDAGIAEVAKQFPR